MDVFFYLIIFLLGLCVGSFLNCIIYRLEVGEDFLRGRSYCSKCKTQLGFFDLIPVLSFIFLKGKCRYCSQKISFQYPLVEFFTGLIFVLLLFQYSEITTLQHLLYLAYLLIISSSFIIIFVYDLKHYLIPTKIIYWTIAITLIFNFQFLISKQFSIFSSTIISAAGVGLFFWLIVLISKEEWLGLGDAKLALLLTLFLGFPKILLALFSAFLIGAIIGLILIFLGKKQLKSQIPFAPFLITGTFLALFWGEKIIEWYLKFRLC